MTPAQTSRYWRAWNQVAHANAWLQERGALCPQSGREVTEHHAGVTNASSLTASRLAGGPIQLTLTGQTNLLYAFETSTNLAQWTKITPVRDLPKLSSRWLKPVNTPALWVDLFRFDRAARRVAREIDAGDYDLLFAAIGDYTEAPLVLRDCGQRQPRATERRRDRELEIAGLAQFIEII